MSTPRDRRATVEFPNELEIRLTREFDAPQHLVFDVLSKVEHVRKTFAPFDETVTVCEIDLRVGGDYHYVMVTPDGVECSFRGTFLELDAPHRMVQTWHFDGWPDADAVETVQLHESDGVTTLSYSLAFTDATGRARMTKYDGLESNFDNIAHYLHVLQAA